MSAGERIWASALRSASWAVSSLKEGGFSGEMEISAANPLWCSKMQGHSCFSLLPGENRYPDLGRLRIKNFSFPRLGGASRLGPPWQGLELSHSQS